MQIDKIIVHGGIFHADDVMCVAIAQTINPNVEVERVFRVPEDLPENTIVADIGGGKYDHHQKDAELRENGEKYAACGLLLRDCWQQIFPDEKSYKEFDEKIIRPLEQADNGIEKNPLSYVISGMNPDWDSSENPWKAFEKAVQMMKDVIQNEISISGRENAQSGSASKAMGTAIAEIAGYTPDNGDLSSPEKVLDQCWDKIFPSEESCKMFKENILAPIAESENNRKKDPLTAALDSYGERSAEVAKNIVGQCAESARSAQRAVNIVEKALSESDGRVVTLPQFCPWQETLVPSSAEFVVFPSNRGGYNIQVVPQEKGSFAAKRDLPEAWLTEKPEGCSFVHQGRFIAAFDTEEHAVDAINGAIQRDVPDAFIEAMEGVDDLYDAAKETPKASDGQNQEDQETQKPGQEIIKNDEEDFSGR